MTNPETSAMDALLTARAAYDRSNIQLDIEHELERQERLEVWEEHLIEELHRQPDLADEEPCLGTCQRCGMYWDTRFYPRCPDPCGGYVG